MFLYQTGDLGSVFLVTRSTFYVLVYRAYGAFDAELCTIIWAPVLTNRQFKECMLTYMQYISCIGQMPQKIQGIWCFDAVIFFATFLVFFLSIQCCNAKQFNTIHVINLICSNQIFKSKFCGIICNFTAMLHYFLIQ